MTHLQKKKTHTDPYHKSEYKLYQRWAGEQILCSAMHIISNTKLPGYIKDQS